MSLSGNVAGASPRSLSDRKGFAWLSWSRFIGIAAVLLTVWLLMVPLAGLLLTAFAEDTIYGPGDFTLENFKEAYASSRILLLFWNSFVFAGGGAALTILMGGLVAWAVERTDMPGREIFHGLTLLTFALPGLLTTMAWMLILSPNVGWVNALIKQAFGLTNAPFNIYTMGGMMWIMASHYFPLAYLLLGPAFRSLDVRMEEAALMSGGLQRQVTRRITFPLMRPAILSTLLLLFIRGVESFDIPRLVGKPARIQVFTTDIQDAIRGSHPEVGIASALSLTLLAICVLTVWLYRRSTRNAEAYATITGKGYKPTSFHLGGWRWPICIGISAMFFIALGLPLLTLFWQSLFQKIAQPFVQSGGEMSFHNYAFVLGYPIFLDAVKTSVTLGVMAATFVVLLTFLLAWIAQRALPRFGWMLDVAAFLPIAFPSIIVGASILFAYLLLPIPVYNTIWILLIAYVTLFMPYGMRFASGGLLQIHKELEEAAQTSGASQGQMFRRVLMPLLAPVALSAWIYIFVLAVRELGASIMLVGPGTHVLGSISLTMWEEGGSYGAVCALGMIQIAPLIVIVALLRRLERHMSKGGAH